MIQKIETIDRLYVIDTDTEWDGNGYPTMARTVWACLLSNQEERADLEAFFDRMHAIHMAEVQANIDAQLKAETIQHAEADRTDQIKASQINNLI